MKTQKKTLGLALVALLAAYGCALSQDSQDSDDSAGNGQTNDELIFGHGNVDHAAIVEVTTMMLAGDPTGALLDPYNQEDPFAIRSGSYSPTFKKRLAAFDAYDGKTDWPADGAAAWSSRVASGNYLVLDTSKPCDYANPHTYLEIERAQMTGRDHETCGGRMPNEDALDVTLNFLIRGPAASAQDGDAIHDGVDHATQQATDTFPYLAEMNGL